MKKRAVFVVTFAVLFIVCVIGISHLENFNKKEPPVATETTASSLYSETASTVLPETSGTSESSSSQTVQSETVSTEASFSSTLPSTATEQSSSNSEEPSSTTSPSIDPAPSTAATTQEEELGSTVKTGVIKNSSNPNVSKVYFTSDISSEGMMKIYSALGKKLPGRVACKLSTGESSASNYLRPALIGDLVKSVNGTIVECNTAYGGVRSSTVFHKQLAADHGFTSVADVDILDADGSMKLPIEGGKHLSYNLVGSHFANYDSYLVLSHFKGHPMGGFGGSLKNISIGLASKQGKCRIHTAGKSNTVMLGLDQDAFLECMADAAKSVVDYLGNERITFINVMNNLSVDCDCVALPAAPAMADVGILASDDPVALDQACVDIVYYQKNGDGKALVSRIESLNGLHTLERAEANGLGSRNYELISID